MTLNVLAHQPSTPPIPFTPNDRYTGKISVTVWQDFESSAFFIQAIGERISLEMFQGPYLEQFQNCFGDRVVKHISEFEDCKEIFGDPIARKEYANGKPQTDKQIINRIEFNARRALEGNPFTGFAVVENNSRKIIGFASIGRGPINGESQSAIILNKDYHRQKYGLETAILMGALANHYYTHQYKVGSKLFKEPVKLFSATCKDSNEKMIQFMKKIGFEKIRSVDSKKCDAEEVSTLYGADAQEVSSLLEKFVDLENVTFETLKSSN